MSELAATPNNMRKCEAAGIKAIMLDVTTGATYSADSGDYFWLGDDEQLPNSILVREIPAQLVDIDESELG